MLNIFMAITTCIATTIAWRYNNSRMTNKDDTQDRDDIRTQVTDLTYGIIPHNEKVINITINNHVFIVTTDTCIRTLKRECMNLDEHLNYNDFELYLNNKNIIDDVNDDLVSLTTLGIVTDTTLMIYMKHQGGGNYHTNCLTQARPYDIRLSMRLTA
jgi:hypothetical protein